MIIQKTTEYKKFSLHRKNRKLDFAKVQRLSGAIEKNNLLHLFPIVVDKDYVILDGQHRFQAAKDVNAEISFVIADDEYGIDRVAETNNFQSHWKLDDYVLFYSTEDKKNYRELLHLSLKYTISAGVIAAIEGRDKIHKAINTGEFKFMDLGGVINVLEFALEFNNRYSFKHWRRREFLKALRHILRINDFNKKQLFDQIEKNPKLLVRCFSQEEYINIFQEIYNKNSKKPVRFL
jgi:hypothetical protein